MFKFFLIAMLLGSSQLLAQVERHLPHDFNESLYPPLHVEILDSALDVIGNALIYPNFIEIENEGGLQVGRIGVVYQHGRIKLYLVSSDQKRTMVGTGYNYRLYNDAGTLVGYYHWTAIWSHVYDLEMRLLGKAQCIAYQGVCAAGIAGYLLSLYN